jgi:quercetin dioxygenase-like cupin family protein
MDAILLKTTIGEGADQQVDKIFESAWTRILQITLRNGKTLEKHIAREPITIQCVRGEGILVLGDGSRTELTPGIIVPLEAEVQHAIESRPAVSILVTRFNPR